MNGLRMYSLVDVCVYMFFANSGVAQEGVHLLLLSLSGFVVEMKRYVS